MVLGLRRAVISCHIAETVWRLERRRNPRPLAVYPVPRPPPPGLVHRQTAASRETNRYNL